MRLIVPETIDPRHVEVYRLADQGQSPHQIAQRLNRPSGEIELILALRAR
jgi:DNA-binding NarL/FixJ family response regulator